MHVHLPHYPPERFLRESENGPYGGAVAAIDWATDVLLDELKSLGLDEDTLVIFTSDNGSRMQGQGGSNGELRGIKGTTWEGGVRVPMIARWLGKVPAGRVCSELTLSMDLCPTLAAVGGSEMPEDRIIDGKDIQPILYGEDGAKSEHDAFFYYKKNVLEAVRSGKWKLHIRREEPRKTGNLTVDTGKERAIEELRELYDLESDIGDSAVGIEGENIRPAGRVDNPDTLTRYDPEHPYMIAMYDLEERG